MALEVLVPAIISALIPYLAKGGEKLVEKTVEEGFENRGKIWQMVKGLFIEDELTLLNLEKNPENPEIQAEFRGELKHLLKANPDVILQLEELIKKLPAAQVKQNKINQTGNDNIAVQDVTGSDIKINK